MSHCSTVKKTAYVSILLSAAAVLILEFYGERSKAETVTLTLNNGDKIKGILIKEESNENIIIIEHPNLGRMEIQSSALKPIPKKKRWTGSFSAGITGTNTDQDREFDSTAQLTTQYKDDVNLLTLRANSEYGFTKNSTDRRGETDTNQGQVDVRYAYTFSGRLSAYASNTFEYDTLNDIGANNLINSIGLGYDLVSTETTTLNISAGPAAQSVWGGTGCAANKYCGNTYPATSARISFNWTPSKYFDLSLSNQYTNAYADGLSASNNFSGTIKIYPLGDQKLFTSLNGQLIYSALTTPEVNNSVSLQLGTQLF